MGNDTSIVQAARVSYGKGTKKKHMDRGLIRYLLRHDHTTPFEMCEIKLHLRVPMDAWRQWIRHRTASINEYSTRYSVAIAATQATQPDEWRIQAANNKQGSDGTLNKTEGKNLTDEERQLHEMSRNIYEKRLEMGIAREQARKDLPLCTYTEAYWKIDLHNLLHFLRLRMEANAQYEIRMYAKTIGEEIVNRWCPLTWEAFQDYKTQSESFSKAELSILSALLKGEKSAAIKLAQKHDLLKYVDGKPSSNLERMELENKMLDLGIDPPWSE
jgi:thymidylate synthase (FAD)